MTTQPAHDDLSAPPFWQVQAVFDPDGTGRDFAYTIGLSTRGLPELHIWARPSVGDDPGEDWMLSIRDRTYVLNELAGLMVAGRLGIGTEVTREYDGGLARVTYRVDPPGDREELEALGVPEGADVLPVRWSLHRAAEGPLRPLTPEAERAARHLYESLVGGLDPRRRAPRGWALPDSPCFDADQRFGPLTPVVLARAAQLWQADDERIADLLHAAAATAVGHALTGSASIAMAAARPCGRRTALATLHDATHELLDGLTTAPPARRRWREIVRISDPGWWESLDREGRREVQDGFASLLHDLALDCLSVEAVADVADAALLLEGRGPWERGIRREALLSHPDWEAPPLVVDEVRRALGSFDARGLGMVAGIHAIAMTGRVEGVRDYPQLCERLLSWATVSAAVCPRRVLDALPGWQPLLAAVPGGCLVSPPELHEWGTCLTSALTHRARLSADDVRTFTLPYEIDLPQLRDLLNGLL